MSSGAGAHEIGGTAPYYFVPSPSKWPMVGAIAMVFFGLGLASWFNDAPWGPYLFAVFCATLAYMFIGWFTQVSRESEAGLYSKRVDASFRWSMSWFIFSEVMFFGAFFGALFYARNFAVPWLGDIDSRALLWPDFTATWPTIGPAGVYDSFQSIGPWPIPTINTALLLTSGVTLTISHYALKGDRRGPAAFWLLLTVLLGFTFLAFQVYEYVHAYHELNLKLSSGIFGSTFFLLTGFHGFHVTIGAVMLSVILLRLLNGHFRGDHHFAFEAAAWYWHFVDAVWLGLYVVVYWL